MFLFENRILKCRFTNVSQLFTKIYLSKSNQKMLKCVVSSTTFLCLCMYLFVKYIPRHSGYKYEPISTLSIHRSYLNEGHNAIVTHFKSSLRLL